VYARDYAGWHEKAVFVLLVRGFERERAVVEAREVVGDERLRTVDLKPLEREMLTLDEESSDVVVARQEGLLVNGKR
jgi:hypothetical protein